MLFLAEIDLIFRWFVTSFYSFHCVLSLTFFFGRIDIEIWLEIEVSDER